MLKIHKIKKIGFVGRFPNINDNGGTQPVRVIPALHLDGTNNVDKIVVQSKSFATFECINKILLNTNYI